MKWFPSERGAGLATDTSPMFYDDCRPGDASGAWRAIDSMRKGTTGPARVWPHMGALGCLVAESHSLKYVDRTKSYERDAFLYSNVASLITRIRRCVDDPLFTSVVDVSGGTPTALPLDWQSEGIALVEKVFGGSATRWKVHIVDLRNVAHDLMPLVLGSLLELYAFELFRRGQQETTQPCWYSKRHIITSVSSATRKMDNASPWRMSDWPKKVGSLDWDCGSVRSGPQKFHPRYLPNAERGQYFG